MSQKFVELCASAIITLVDPAPKHIDIICLDSRESKKIFGNPALKSVVSMDASRIGMDDNDAIAIAESESLSNLKWLSLAGSDVTEKGVRAICKAIKEKKFNLAWLDLRASKYNATPYLDGGAMDNAYWRIPRNGHLLYEEFGHQEWMTVGKPREEENCKLVDVRTFRPNRFLL